METNDQTTQLPPSPGATCCASFVRMFKPRFAEMVARGEKLQTVRPIPKRRPKPGDKISLRCWTGLPYRSKQRVLLETTVTDVRTCQINDDALMVDGDWCPRETMEWFARRDGFASWAALAEWFRLNHGPLPFWGIIIFWHNAVALPTASETHPQT